MLKLRQKYRGVKIKFFQPVKRPTQVCTSPNLNFLDSTVNFNIFFAYQQTQSMSFLSSLRAYAKWGIKSERVVEFQVVTKPDLRTMPDLVLICTRILQATQAVKS